VMEIALGTLSASSLSFGSHEKCAPPCKRSVVWRDESTLHEP
jgi:hypothetical protein